MRAPKIGITQKIDFESVAESDSATTALSWTQAHRAYIETALHGLRLRLRRRALYLRSQWNRDSLQGMHGLVIGEAQADFLFQGEDADAEGRFYSENAEAREIGDALTRHEQQQSLLAALLTDAGSPPALDIIAQLFNLSDFERSVLLLCLAPEIDPAFESLFAYIQDDATRRRPTPALARTLFSERRDDGDALLPDAPLRRYRLLASDSGGSAPLPLSVRPLRLEDRVTHYLMGENRLEERVQEMLRSVSAAPLSPMQWAEVERLCRYLGANAGRPSPDGWPALNLYGPPDGGASVVARALCDAIRLPVYRLDPSRLPPPSAERQEILSVLERETILLPMTLYLDAMEIRSERPSEDAAALNAVLERLRGFMIIGSETPWRTERETIRVAVPRPDSREQRDLWAMSLRENGENAAPFAGTLLALTQQFDLGPVAIARIVGRAKEQVHLVSPLSPDAPLTPETLWQICREDAGQSLDDLATRLKPCHGWDDIVLPPRLSEQLREVAGQVARRPTVYEDWGMGAKLNRGRGISALFAGPSGTGKTLAAEILAGHLNLDMYRIDLAGMVSKYIGETEKNLRRVFDAAERSGAILFFDEADALFGKRSEVKDSHDRYANIEINYLLQRMEEYRGLAILATNMRGHLDQAFLRRLRFLVEFPFPDADSRRRIWEGMFPASAPQRGIDFDALSRMEIAGGNIKNIALNAAFRAADADEPIQMTHLLQAARQEYAKVEQLFPDFDFPGYPAHGGR